MFHFTARSSLIRKEKFEKEESEEPKGDVVVNTKSLHVIFTRLQLTHNTTSTTSVNSVKNTSKDE